MRKRATSRLAATAAVVSLLAAACAGSGDIHADAPTGSSPSSTSTPSTVVRSCGSVAPARLVGAVLALPTTGPRQFNLGRGVIQCVYGAELDKPAVMRFYNNVDTTSFATLEAAAAGHGQTVTNVRFEDQAFTSTSTGRGLTLTELFARKGSLVIAVISSASLGAEETLETRVFANVYHL